jgi:uncharacterized membrane protein
MQVLLINQNATIERLVKLSSGKLGYELVSAKDISDVESAAYGFVIIDSDLYNDEEFAILKQNFSNAKYILIITKGAQRPEGFDVYVEKPFLPTELVDIFNSLASSVTDDFFADDSVFDNAESEVGAFDADTSFAAPSEQNEELSDASGALDDDFGSISLEEQPADLEEMEEPHLEMPDEHPEFESKEPTLDDSDSIKLDEQIGDIQDEMKDIDFERGLTSIDDIGESLSDATKEPSDVTMDMAEEPLLEEKQHYEEEPEIDNLTTAAEEDELAGMGDFSFDNDGKLELDEDEIGGIEEESTQSDTHILDEDEVNKLKNLLDETEEEKLENEEFDVENIKIHNDELGSLTEESLAEALGVNLNNISSSESSDNLESDLESGLDSITSSLPDIKDNTLSSATTNIPTNTIQLNPNQSITISLDALKELLNMADVTINITLSKKQ